MEGKQTTPKKNTTPVKAASDKRTPGKTPSKSDKKTPQVSGKSDLQSKDSKDGLNHLPLARIRTIMKSAPDADMISQEALVVVCRAAEMFIQQLTKAAKEKSTKQNLLEYKDLANVVGSDEKLEFLASIIPKKITVREYKKRLAEDSSSDERSYESTEESSEEESGIIIFKLYH
uniref:Chromatin accessibility complex protein 1 n=1 Tax=Culicoides sonorensis TaxID=179676 RepID=A0A336MFI5_CULSO